MIREFLEIMLCKHKINKEDGDKLITAWLPVYELLISEVIRKPETGHELEQGEESKSLEHRTGVINNQK